MSHQFMYPKVTPVRGGGTPRGTGAGATHGGAAAGGGSRPTA